MKTKVEWEVQEQHSKVTESWYQHGYKGTNCGAAHDSLDRKREQYGQYGRVFRLIKREITEKIVGA